MTAEDVGEARAIEVQMPPWSPMRLAVRVLLLAGALYLVGYWYAPLRVAPDYPECRLDGPLTDAWCVISETRGIDRVPNAQTFVTAFDVPIVLMALLLVILATPWVAGKGPTGSIQPARPDQAQKDKPLPSFLLALLKSPRYITRLPTYCFAIAAAQLLRALVHDVISSSLGDVYASFVGGTSRCSKGNFSGRHSLARSSPLSQQAGSCLPRLSLAG